MTKKIRFSLLIMIFFSFATIWDSSWRYYPFIFGFACIIAGLLVGTISLGECGLNFFSLKIMFEKGIHRQLFFVPLVVVALEILIGKLLFGHFSEYALGRLDAYLIFNNSATLILLTIVLIAFEEIPWRCHFQLYIGRQYPNGWALLLPAVCISALALSFPISALSMYFLLGVFVRRILWGLLYENSGSIWLVILSHFFAVMFYLILLVGL